MKKSCVICNSSFYAGKKKGAQFTKCVECRGKYAVLEMTKFERSLDDKEAALKKYLESRR